MSAGQYRRVNTLCPSAGPGLGPVSCPGYKTCLISLTQHRTQHRVKTTPDRRVDGLANYANFICHSKSFILSLVHNHAEYKNIAGLQWLITYYQ